MYLQYQSNEYLNDLVDSSGVRQGDTNAMNNERDEAIRRYGTTVQIYIT